jgi:hypothetical protein
MRAVHRVSNGSGVLDLNYTAWWFWINVFQMVCTAALGLYVWWTNREKVTGARFLSLERQVAERATAQALKDAEHKRDGRCEQHKEALSLVEKSVIEVRSELDHLPTQKQFNQLNVSISDLNGSLQKTAGRLEGINRVVDLINEHFINRGKGE